MKLAAYLGMHVSKMLEREPFKGWTVERSTEEDLDELIIHYVFTGHGLELRCDSAETVSVIFMHSREYGGFREDSLLELPFSSTREQGLEHFGTPSKSGQGRSDSVLGKYGAWDRFARAGFAIHVEYRAEADCVDKITLMRGDVVP